MTKSSCELINTLAERISNLTDKWRDKVRLVIIREFFSCSYFSVRVEICCPKMSGETIVETEYGKVRGVVKTSEYKTDYVAFLGIRYARPPIGDLRFKVGDDKTFALHERRAQMR